MKRLVCLFVLLLSLWVWSCKSSIEDDDEDLESVKFFELPQEGGCISIQVQENADCRLRIPSSFRSWISEIPNSDEMGILTFDLMISENDSFEKREGYVIISVNGKDDTVHIYQAQRDLLFLTEDVCRLYQKGGDITMKLRANVDYDIMIPKDAAFWISWTETKTIRTDLLVFHVEANDSDKERMTKIVVKDKTSTLDDTLYVYQDGYSYTGDVVLETTKDVQDFADRGIKKLMGSLIVQVSNLDSLTVLEEISDNLIIDGPLISFDGLYGLKRIGGDFIIKNGRFTCFEGLNHLEHIGGSFCITSLASTSPRDPSSPFDGLKNFVGLESLVEIGEDFVISSSASVSTYWDNPAPYSLRHLENFRGLESLGRIGGSFCIKSGASSATPSNFGSSLGSLRNFVGLESLVEIGEDFVISSGSGTNSNSLRNLENFCGLENLGRIGGSFRITSNSNSRPAPALGLRNFVGLESLVEIVGDFEISCKAQDDDWFDALSSLENFCGLDNLSRIGGSFRITFPSGASAPDSFLSSLNNFVGLSSLTEIGGDFISSKYFSVLTTLEKLTTVGGDMGIPLINGEDIHFTALQSIGGALRLSSSFDYVNYEKSSFHHPQSNLYLPALKTVGKEFLLRFLKSVDIPLIESVGGAVTILGVDAIDNLNNLKTVEGDIRIAGCLKLTDFCNWRPVLMNHNYHFSISDCGFTPIKQQILNGYCSK